MESSNYALGQTTNAMRRLEIQDAQFAEISERLLDAIALRPDERVVELGTGPGGLSRRIMQRLGDGGVLVGVDFSQSLLDQASRNVAGISTASFEPVLADVQQIGSWIDDADVVLGRTVLHHIPLAESFVGTLRTAIQPGTRVGFVEPEFRALLANIRIQEIAGRPELAVLRIWAEGIARYYQASQLSDGVGSTLGLTMELAGFESVKSTWSECPADESVVENMLLYYEEVRPKYVELNIMTDEEIDKQITALNSLPTDDLPPVWGVHMVTGIV